MVVRILELSAQHLFSSESASRFPHSRWRREGRESSWVLRYGVARLLTLPRWLTRLRMLILLDMTELSRIWVVEVERGTVSPSPRNIGVKTTRARQGWVRPTWSQLYTHCKTAITWANITIVSKAWVLKQKRYNQVLSTARLCSVLTNQYL